MSALPPPRDPGHTGPRRARPEDKRCDDCGDGTVKIVYLCLPGRYCPGCGLMTGPAAFTPGVADEPGTGPWIPVFIYEGPYVLALLGYLLGLWRLFTGKARRPE